MTKLLRPLAFSLILAGCSASSDAPDMAGAVGQSPLGTPPPLSFSAERYCQSSLPLTRVTVVPQEAPVFESNERNIRSLTFSHPAYHKGQVILGSTETAFQLDMIADLVSRPVPDSQDFCSKVNVKVVVSMRFHVVNIARELKPGTCGYNKVREHEYRHVAVNRESLYRAAAVLQQEMREFLGQQVFYGDPGHLREDLRVAIESHWMPRLQKLKEGGLTEHQAIDTVDEYASNNTDCDGEIPALLHSDTQFESLLDSGRASPGE